MLLLADARHIPLAAETVQCVVTSPPYWGLRDYGEPNQLGLEPTPDLYVEHMVEVFREVRRVLRPDGTLWLNLGDSYHSQPAGNVAPSGFSQTRPSRRRHGVGAETVDIPRLRTLVGLKPKDLVGIPWRVAFALQADGWWLRSDIVWSKPNPMPESVTDRPTKAHEYLFLLTKSERYFYDQDATREAVQASSLARVAQNGGNPTFDGARERRANGHRAGRDTLRPDQLVPEQGRNARSVWTIATQPYPEAHFATFPEELPERCIQAGTAKGDTVLDPFCGSGTTGAVALRLGRKFVGLDLSAEYLELARHRVDPLGGQQHEARLAATSGDDHQTVMAL